MSLNFDLTRIDNWKNLCYVTKDGKQLIHPDTDAILWATIAIGMGEITQKNWEDFWMRLTFFECKVGLNMTPPLVVKAHIGLKTNVFPQETPAAFLKKMWRSHCQDRSWELRKLEEQDPLEQMAAVKLQPDAGSEAVQLPEAVGQ